MTDSTDEASDKERPAHLFKPGQSGNPKGRPKGSRHKLAKNFLEDLLADWKANGASALQAVRSEKPEVYVKVVADLLPKQVDIEGKHEHTHRAVSNSAAWLERMLGDGEAGSLPPPVPH